MWDLKLTRGTEIGVKTAIEEVISAMAFLKRFGEKMPFIHSTITHQSVKLIA